MPISPAVAAIYCEPRVHEDAQAAQRTTWIVVHGSVAGTGEVLGGVLNATETEARATAVHFWSLYAAAGLALLPWHAAGSAEQAAAGSVLLFPASESLQPEA